MDLLDRSPSQQAGGPQPKPLRRWSLATSANLAIEHDMSLDTLATGRPAVAVARMLSTEWGIASRIETLEVCDWLARCGHRAEFDKAIANKLGVDLHHEADARGAVAELTELGVCGPDIPTDTTVWDAARLVHVARCAFDLGYLSDDEAWAHIDSATFPLGQRYGSWTELSANYLLAWRIWRPTDVDFADRVAHHRMLTAGENSPWNYIAW
jgi:Protein of unknown function (DUF1266)